MKTAFFYTSPIYQNIESSLQRKQISKEKSEYGPDVNSQDLFCSLSEKLHKSCYHAQLSHSITPASCSTAVDYMILS